MSTISAVAVRTPAAAITSLAKLLEPSIRAAAALGPKQATPASRTASATPATSGTSGPITTRSACQLRASAAAALWIEHVQPVLLGDPRGAGVARCAGQRRDLGVLGHGQHEGVLTSTGPHHQDAHDRQC